MTYITISLLLAIWIVSKSFMMPGDEPMCAEIYARIPKDFLRNDSKVELL